MTGDDQAQALWGSHCPTCERTYFPPRGLCPTCHATDLPPRALARTGVLATSTVVHVGTTHPTPYALGYADLPDSMRVLGRIDDWSEGDDLAPGTTVRVVADNVDDGSRRRTTDHVFLLDAEEA